MQWESGVRYEKDMCMLLMYPSTICELLYFTCLQIEIVFFILF